MIAVGWARGEGPVGRDWRAGYSVQSVRAVVQARIRHWGYDGGLVIGPANGIMYDTPAENVVATYEAANDFRRDGL